MGGVTLQAKAKRPNGMGLQINLNSISGVKEFDYRAGSALFSSMEAAGVSDAAIEAHLKLRPVANEEFDLELRLQGWLEVACDVCLEPLRLPVEEGKQLKVAYGNPEDTDDERLLVPEKSPIVDADSLIRDYAILSIPLRHVCAKHESEETE